MEHTGKKILDGYVMFYIKKSSTRTDWEELLGQRQLWPIMIRMIERALILFGPGTVSEVVNRTSTDFEKYSGYANRHG